MGVSFLQRETTLGTPFVNTCTSESHCHLKTTGCSCVSMLGHSNDPDELYREGIYIDRAYQKMNQESNHHIQVQDRRT